MAGVPSFVEASNGTGTATTRSGTLVQLASYNTNLQGTFTNGYRGFNLPNHGKIGDRGTPQDLVDWLAPTLTVSSFLSGASSTNLGPPDIVAVGFQELLPLHLGCEHPLHKPLFRDH